MDTNIQWAAQQMANEKVVIRRAIPRLLFRIVKGTYGSISMMYEFSGMDRMKLEMYAWMPARLRYDDVIATDWAIYNEPII